MNASKLNRDLFSKILCLCICCLSLYCISWSEIETGEEKDKEIKAECEKYAHEIYNKFAEDALKNLGLYCTHTQGGSTRHYGPRKVEIMEVICSVPKALTIRDARKLEVQAAELLLDIINKHEKIRPFLKEHPCSVNTIKLSINFKEEDCISVTTLTKGTVYYCVLRPNDEALHPIAEEPYSKARQLVLEN